jgi:hypothetical protein
MIIEDDANWHNCHVMCACVPRKLGNLKKLFPLDQNSALLILNFHT